MSSDVCLDKYSVGDIAVVRSNCMRKVMADQLSAAGLRKKYTVCTLSELRQLISTGSVIAIKDLRLIKAAERNLKGVIMK